MTRYALALLERNAAIDGTRKAQLALGSQVALTAYAKSLIGKRDRIAVRDKGHDRFNLLIKRATHTQIEQVKTSKQVKVKWIARVRSAYTGVTRGLIVRSVSEQGARRTVRDSLAAFETLVDVVRCKEWQYGQRID